MQHWLGVEAQSRVPWSGVGHVVKHLPPTAIFRGCLPTVTASGMGLVLLESSVTRDVFHICHPTCQCGPEILSGLSCKFHAQMPLPLYNDIRRGKSLILKVPWALSECDKSFTLKKPLGQKYLIVYQVLLRPNALS